MSRPIRVVDLGRNTMTDSDADASLHSSSGREIPRACAILQVAQQLVFMTQTASRQFGRRNVPAVHATAKTFQTAVARKSTRARTFTPGERYFLIACGAVLVGFAALWLAGLIEHRHLMGILFLSALAATFLVRGLVWLSLGIGGRPNGTDRNDRNSSGGGSGWSDDGGDGGD